MTILFANKLTLSFTYRRDRANPVYEVLLGADKRTIDGDTFNRLAPTFAIFMFRLFGTMILRLPQELEVHIGY